MQLNNPQLTTQKIIDNITNVILGKEHEIKLSIIALLCNGHLLIEDVPGVGKTILAKLHTAISSFDVNSTISVHKLLH